MYIIGIDVGGTNTDGTLICDSKVIAMAKTPTNHGDLFSSTSMVLEKVLEQYCGNEPIQLQLSTTLSTNLIVEGKEAPTAVVVVPGPGVNLSLHQFPFLVYEVDGYIDHRGREVSPLKNNQIKELQKVLAEKQQALGVVGKFSNRNPSHEQELGRELSSWHHGIISYGHRLSGRANFPRRIVTTYLNSSVAKQQLEFIKMWEKLHAESAVSFGKILLLKADGGTMTLQDSQERPIETILSGPAASIMGVQALAQCAEDNFVIVDVGGTTTDVAVVVSGQVLFEQSGATISGYKTLVPAVLTRSVGLGGDSSIRYDAEQERLIIGPQRAGLPVCLGGSKLTPTDAAVALGLAQIGEKELAIKAWQEWGGQLNLTWQALAQQTLDSFTEQLTETVETLYAELENTPLYTVSEILTPPEVRPCAVVGLGAPAPVFIPLLAKSLNLSYEVVPFAAGANAIGAAAAQATVGITLHADTELGTVTIPEMGYRGTIDRPLFFDLDRARQFASEQTQAYAEQQGYAANEEIYVVEEESFRMVRDFHTVGEIHTVRTQLRPQVRPIRGGEHYEKQ